MRGFEIRPFLQTSLDPLVGLMNAAIAGRRASATVDAEEFRQRVLEHPGFDPNGLILAVDGSLVVGAIHAIAPPVEITPYRRLAGQGFLLGPYVLNDWRGKGIGHVLLAAAEAYLSVKCDRIWAHGLRTPFYHALEGPRQPYCGSSEMVGLTRDDAGLLRFLHAAGYQEGEEQEVTMVARLHLGREHSTELAGLELVRISPHQPWSGPVKWAATEAGYGYERFGEFQYETLAVAQEGVLMGHCQWYPMRRPGRAALYDLRLDPSLRGNGIGKALLEGGLDAMWRAGYREVELHTSPQRNAVAYGMYQRYGFTMVEEWLPLRKEML